MYARTYWPPSYWPQTYWAKEGADPPDGYWQPRYWAMSYWMPNYWPGEPRLVVEPPTPTVGERVPYLLMEANGIGKIGM